MDSNGKPCSVCGEWFDFSMFHKGNGRGKTNSACIPCANKRSNDWYQANRERGIASAKRLKEKRRTNTVDRLYDAARDRATLKGLDFTILPQDIVVPDVCPAINCEFTYTGGRASASSYSLDRIDPSKGYVKDNIQVISRKANTIKNNATKEELLHFAKWIIDTYGEE